MCDKACVHKLLQPDLAESASGKENCNKGAELQALEHPIALPEFHPCIDQLWLPVAKPGGVCFEVQMETSSM